MKRGAYEFLKAAPAAIAIGALAAGVQQGVTSATAKYLEKAMTPAQDTNLRIQQSQALNLINQQPFLERRIDMKKVLFETPIAFPTTTHLQYPSSHYDTV